MEREKITLVLNTSQVKGPGCSIRVLRLFKTSPRKGHNSKIKEDGVEWEDEEELGSASARRGGKDQED